MDYTDRLKEITCPVYVICEEKDGANRKAAVSLHSAVDNSELIVVKGARHEVNIDAPEMLSDIVRKGYDNTTAP